MHITWNWRHQRRVGGKLTDGIRRIEVLVVRIICDHTATLNSRAFPELWRRLFHDLLLSSSSTNNDNDDDTVLRSSLSSRHATLNLTQWKGTIDATIRQGSENHRTITNQL
mmetsp:Transcript_7898/g.8702  ORF Transcript_7898/g.8702 Transcript_7898/m.8702 type:complete len:111 (+) Transcript_7898:52-384(+)